jgi:hypothetical protein
MRTIQQSPWLQVTQSMRGLPWFAEAFVARHAQTPAEGRLHLQDLRFLLEWMLRLGLSKATTLEALSLGEVAQLSSSNLAKYQAALLSAPNYRSKSDALRNLRLVQALLTDTVAWLGRTDATLLDLRDPETVRCAIVGSEQRPLVIVTCARLEEDLWPSLSDRQLVVSPCRPGQAPGVWADAILAAPAGVWDVAWLVERLPRGFESATLIVQTDGALTQRPARLAAWPGPRLLCALTPELAPLSQHQLASYTGVEPFEAILTPVAMHAGSLGSRTPSGTPTVVIPGLLSRFVAPAPMSAPQAEVVVLAPCVRASEEADGHPLLPLAARMADALLAAGLRVSLFEGTVEACLKRAAASLIALWAGPGAGFVGLLGAGVMPVVSASFEAAPAGLWRPGTSHLAYGGRGDLQAVVKAALATGHGTVLALREGFEAWQCHGRLAETRRRLWDIRANELSGRAPARAGEVERHAEPPEGGRSSSPSADMWPLGSDPVYANLDPSWLLEQPPSGGPTLKLYIDSTSLSVIHQMADFVRCEFDPEVYKVITWRRCVLDQRELAASQTRYIQQGFQVSQQFVDFVVDTVARLRPRHVEIHSNQRWSFQGVFPVLRHLFSVDLLQPEAISLVLYDDGLWSLQERDAMLRNVSIGADLELAALGLARRLFGSETAPPTRWMGHVWHRVLRTRYVGLRLARFSEHAGPHPAVRGYLGMHQEMQFAYREELTATEWKRFLHFYGLDDVLEERLSALRANPGSFLYIGTSTTDPERNQYYARKQVSSIKRFKESGLFPPETSFAFKGHPADTSLEQLVMEALGGQILHIPARIPLEVLQMADLLPPNIVGVWSTAYLTLDCQRVRFVFGTPPNPGNLPKVGSDYLLECGVLSPEQVRPWPD